MPWATARRDPLGMHVGFDISSPAKVTSVVVDMRDGEPNDVWGNSAAGGTDYRAFRGFNVKPSLTGTFTPTLTATDTRGCTATVTAPHPVTVVTGG